MVEQETRAEQQVLRWVLHGYSLMPSIYPSSVQTSRTFRVGGHPLCILFYPGGTTSSVVADGSLHVAWFIKNLSMHSLDVGAHLRVIGRDGKTVCESSLIMSTIEPLSNLGKSADLPKQDMSAGASENGDSLTLVVSVTVLQHVLLHDDDDHDTLSDLLNRQGLGHDMKRLLDKGTFSDVRLVVAGSQGDESFAAHKSILVARSPVFAAMLKSGMQEAKTGTIKIACMPPAVLVELLHFLYVGALSQAAYAAGREAVVEEDKKRQETPTNRFSLAISLAMTSQIKASRRARKSSSTAAAAVAAAATTAAAAAAPAKTPVSATTLSMDESKDVALTLPSSPPPAPTAETLVAHLLVAADRYEIPSLGQACSRIMARGLCEDNFADMFLFADRHHCASLKASVVALLFVSHCVLRILVRVSGQAHCLKFIQSDKGRLLKIKQTQSYKNLDKVLLFELLDAMSGVAW